MKSTVPVTLSDDVAEQPKSYKKCLDSGKNKQAAPTSLLPN